MTTRNTTRLLGMSLALALTAGCTLFDDGTRVRLDPVGRIYANGPVAIRIHAPGHAQALLVLNGRVLDGSYPVDADVALDFGPMADGVYRLAARVYDGEQARDSDALEVVVDRIPPTFTVTPAPGEYVSTAPFAVVVWFSEPVDAASVSPATLRLVSDPAPGTVIPAAVSLAGDARSATVTASARLDQIGAVHLEVDVRDLAGHSNTPTWSLPAWRAPRLSDQLVVQTDPLCSGSLNGTWHGRLDIVSWRYDARAQYVDVLVDGSPIGRLSPTQTRVTWDTRLFSNGAHSLRFEAPGFIAFDGGTVIVNNTPPRVVSCTPHLHEPDDASVVAGVDVLFSEPVCTNISYSVCPPYCWSGMTDRIVAYPGAQGPLPFSWTFSFPGVLNASGLPVASSPACTVSFPTWLKPWGSVPLDDGSGAPFGPAAIRSLWDLSAVGTAELVRLATAGAPTPGAVQVMRSVAPAPWTADPATLNGTPFAPASQLHLGSGGNAAVWLEVDGSGSQRVRVALRNEGVTETVTTVDALLGPVEIGSPGFVAVTWAQAGATGTREVRVAQRSPATGWIVAPAANANAGADASQPCAIEGSRIRVAFVEMGPGGVSQLRVRELQDDGLTWVSLGDVLNLDPAVSAQEPSLESYWDGSATVAWVEGGQVLARRGDWLGNWGPPMVLNADPASAARAPRAIGYQPRVVFIERAVDGDRFEVREWIEPTMSWRPVPSPPAGTQVASYTVYDAPLAIVWTDATGESWLRIYNAYN